MSTGSTILYAQHLRINLMAPRKLYPTSVLLPSDLRDSIKRACAAQGCAMVFKINQVLREWETKFLAQERELGRGQVRE